MKTQRLIISLACVMMCVLFFAGCSIINSGYVGHGICTEVQLNQSNYTVLRTVTGTAKADYIFLIGTSKQDLVGRAMRDMLDKAQLKGSQAIINVTTDEHLQAFPLWPFPVWIQMTVYVSAEVVEFK